MGFGLAIQYWNLVANGLNDSFDIWSPTDRPSSCVRCVLSFPIAGNCKRNTLSTSR